MRKEYEMTQTQLDKLLDACKPTPAMGFKTPQENANRAWRALGDEMGFNFMTVEPSEKGSRFFTAEANEPAA